MAMIHHNGLTVSAHEIGERNYPIGGRNNRMPIAAADINATVKCTFPVEGSMRSPKLPVTWPSTGQRLGAALARYQSAVVALRVIPRLIPTVASPVRAEVRSTPN